MRLALVLLLAGLGSARAEPATFAGRVAPVLQGRCTECHGPAKQKAGLRLDGLAAILKGSDDGEVVRPGDPAGSELFRRVTLPPTDDDFMPSGGQRPLSPAEVGILGKWIAAGAPAEAPFELARPGPPIAAEPAAPDYRPRLAQAAALARKLGVRLVPRSRVPTDGLALETASAPSACDDAALAGLAPVADLIVTADLARSRVTDKGLEALAQWPNLAALDLTRTAVTSGGIAHLAPLARLESLNLTETRVGGAGVAAARRLPALKKLWTFGCPE